MVIGWPAQPGREAVLFMGMQPLDFIRKWKAVELTESAASQFHFIDLCNLLGEETPTDADGDGSWYCFERGPQKPLAAKAGPMCGNGSVSAGIEHVFGL